MQMYTRILSRGVSLAQRTEIECNELNIVYSVRVGKLPELETMWLLLTWSTLQTRPPPRVYGQTLGQ